MVYSVSQHIFRSWEVWLSIFKSWFVRSLALTVSRFSVVVSLVIWPSSCLLDRYRIIIIVITLAAIKPSHHQVIAAPEPTLRVGETLIPDVPQRGKVEHSIDIRQVVYQTREYVTLLTYTSGKSPVPTVKENHNSPIPVDMPPRACLEQMEYIATRCSTSICVSFFDFQLWGITASKAYPKVGTKTCYLTLW